MKAEGQDSAEVEGGEVAQKSSGFSALSKIYD
jgi:hypothetical protein